MRRIATVPLLTPIALLLLACDGDGADTERVRTVEFVADDLVFDEMPAEVAAGTVEFAMDNQGDLEHDLTIEELGDQRVVARTAGGTTASGTVQLEPGTYTLYCSVPGHRDGGMEETLEVTE